jgi:gliding-associated putative ABC transporter substrate-binding component GldG
MSEKKAKSFVYNWTFLTIVCVGLVLVNIIGSLLYFRYDATEDKRYSLSDGTIEFLSDENNFTDRISLRIYLDGNLPAELKRYRIAIEDKLKEFKQYAGNRLEYTFIDPMQGTEEDQRSLFEILYNRGKGIMPMEVMYMKDGSNNQMLLWPGAEIEYGGSTVSHIQLMPGTPQGQWYELNTKLETQIQNSINNLEYMLLSSIRRVTQIKKPRLAFLQGHGELTYAQTQRVRNLVSPYYTIEDLYLNDSIDALKGVDGLVIARPTQPFSEKDKYLIDQFVMKGGKLMCFIDKLNVPEDTLMKNGFTHTTRYTLELDRMLFDYGIKINDNLVFDKECAPKHIPAAKQQLIPWFFSICSTPTIHPISRNVEPVLLNYASQIQFVGNGKNIKSPILTTSSNAFMTGLAPIISIVMHKDYWNNPQFVADPTDEVNKICVAGLVEGHFTSHFKNRIVSTFAKSAEVGFKEKSTKEGKVLVVANGRFIENKYDSIPNKSGGYLYKARSFNELKMDETMAKVGLQPLIYGNQEFFQNMVDYMMGDNSVLDLRSKQIDIHSIDKEKVKLESGYYKFVNMLVPSLFVLLIAGILYYLRKRKYVKNEK